MEEQDVIETGGEANPGEIADEVSTEAAAADQGVPGASGEEVNGAVVPGTEENKIQNNLGGKQPSITPDPFQVFREQLGPIRSGDRDVELKDINHVKRLIQSGLGADKVAAQAQEELKEYQAKRQPYEWLNQQLEDPNAKKLFQYFRHDPQLMKTIAGWIPEWEKTGQLDPRVLEVGMTKLQLEQAQSQIQSFTEQQKQVESQQRQQQEVQELWSKVNEYNNGLPFTQKQLAQIEIFRDGMRTKKGFESYTAAQALAELKENGLWIPAKKDPGPGAPGGSNIPAAQRQKPGYAEKSAEQVRAELMANW
jgi:hypothetical protein